MKQRCLELDIGDSLGSNAAARGGAALHPQLADDLVGLSWIAKLSERQRLVRMCAN